MNSALELSMLLIVITHKHSGGVRERDVLTRVTDTVLLSPKVVKPPPMRPYPEPTFLIRLVLQVLHRRAC